MGAPAHGPRPRSPCHERVQVTDEELRQFYDDHPEEFGHGPQIRVRHIYKRTTRQATPAERETARREIEELHRQLGEGASFIELARSHSDSETAQLDGLIGRLDPGALGPKVDRIVWALGEGEISEVVSTPVGFHIFKVDQRIEPFHMEFAEARTRLRRRFERLETEATLAEYLTELLEASGATTIPTASTARTTPFLFALGDLELTRGTFLERVFNLGFNQQRAMPLAEHLEQAVTRELYRWEAERLNLGDEPDLVAQLEQIEQTARVELAYRASTAGARRESRRLRCCGPTSRRTRRGSSRRGYCVCGSSSASSGRKAGNGSSSTRSSSASLQVSEAASSTSPLKRRGGRRTSPRRRGETAAGSIPRPSATGLDLAPRMRFWP